MPKHTLEHGRCNISMDGFGFLTVADNGNVVVSETARGDWSLRCHGPVTDPTPKWIFIFNRIGPFESVLTLDEKSGRNNIIITDLIVGEPSAAQLWTLEEAIMLMRFVTHTTSIIAVPSK